MNEERELRGRVRRLEKELADAKPKTLTMETRVEVGERDLKVQIRKK